MSGKFTIKAILVAVVIAVIGGYALFESRNLIKGPVVRIDEPESGRKIESSITDIKGWTENVVWISMNDREISVDESGRFEEKFVLSEGNNIVKISAKDRFGRYDETLVKIFHESPGESLVQR